MSDVLIQFVGTGYAWGTVLGPAVLSLSSCIALRRVALRVDVALAFVAGLLVSWLTRRWSLIPGDAGLHIFPAAALAFCLLWGRNMSMRPLRDAVVWGAVFASYSWASIFAVDVVGCLGETECSLVNTGGSGWLDTLVLGPTLAMLGTLMCWVAGRLEQRTPFLTAGSDS